MIVEEDQVSCNQCIVCALSPILFMNDLPNVVKPGDDTKLYRYM